MRGVASAKNVNADPSAHKLTVAAAAPITHAMGGDRYHLHKGD